MDDSYKIRLRCENCLQFSVVKIPRGDEVEEYLKTIKDKVCPYCGRFSFGRIWVSYFEDEALDRDKKLLEKLEKKERELICANLILRNLRHHFSATKPNHTCMTIEEYEEIVFASEKQAARR